MSSTVVNVGDRLVSAQYRSQVFWLLADGLLNGLLTESWSEMRNVAVKTEPGGGDLHPLKSAWQNLSDALEHAGKAAGNRLAVEHTRLFSGLVKGAGPAPPFESAWRESQEPGNIAQSVAHAYSEAGFADIDLDAGPQDHLAVEFKFMALLALREVEALRRDNTAVAEARVCQQQAFLDRHLLQWVPRWIDGVAQRTQEPIYWAFVGLIRAGLVQAAEDLSISAE